MNKKDKNMNNCGSHAYWTITQLVKRSLAWIICGQIDLAQKRFLLLMI